MLQLSFLKKQNTGCTEPKSCAFTGHRALGEDFSPRKLKKEIKRMIEQGVVTFYNGMAMGFDLTAAELVLELKKKFPQVKLIACVPCYGQEKRYSAEDKERYANILHRADETVTLAERYHTGCMHERNRYMVDRADYLLAYCHDDKGGTAYTVRYFLSSHDEESLVMV